MAQSEAYKSNDGQWPKYSGFKPIQPDREIRLLQLEPKSDRRGMRYHMHHVELSTSPDYSALSYSWGAPVPDGSLREIFINGLPVRIRPTLYSFLETLAFYEPTRNLWCDAISIDQSNIEERNFQVALMGDIFQTAQTVYVWLGLGDHDTSYLMEHINGPTPQTPYDPTIFSDCAEKLMRASYWTRRWVIQEFALARELIVACGRHLVHWSNVTTEVSKVLANESPAMKMLTSFEGVRSCYSETQSDLLDLMERFKESRCIDLRDRAFALRGIAKDKHRLSPNYDESPASVYFRILSAFTTERVYPERIGYRWPHHSATRLLKCMPITRKDALSSLRGIPNDRLYTVFECIGTVTAVAVRFQDMPGYDYFSSFNLGVRVSRYDPGRFFSLVGCGDVRQGDMVYDLQSTSRSPNGLYIAFRRSSKDHTAVAMLINEPYNMRDYWENVGLSENTIDFVKDLILGGVFKCSHNTNIASRSWTPRILCHISRLTFILLWLLEIRDVDYLSRHRGEIPDYAIRGSTQCSCDQREAALPILTSQGLESTLELLPSCHIPGEEAFWPEVLTHPWVDQNQCLPQERATPGIECRRPPWTLPMIDGSNHDFAKSGLSHAAEGGLAYFTKCFLSKARRPTKWTADQPQGLVRECQEERVTPPESFHHAHHEAAVDTSASDQQTDLKCYEALYLASRAGQAKIVTMLLDAGINSNAPTSPARPLVAAAGNGHEEIVRMLIDAGADFNEARDPTPLACASAMGHEMVVRMLIDVGADLNRAGYRTPLTYASENGHEAVVKILLDAGADVDPTSDPYFFALSGASKNGHEKIVKILLDAGTGCFEESWSELVDSAHYTRAQEDIKDPARCWGEPSKNHQIS